MSASSNDSSSALKDFVFTEKLGTGTYATVYKAYKKSEENRKVVAIKCIKKSSLTRASMNNLIAEIEILKQIKHENVVDLLDFQWDHSYIYMVMEYCAGGDLSRYIKTQRALPELIVKRFLQQLASALQLLHSHNISHLDLKPQNILLSSTEYPTLKLADFGFAQYIENNFEHNALRGSPLYMAPEIIIKRQYTNKVDLWSVGVILFECLYGYAPFASKTFVELENKIKSSEPIQFPAYPYLSDPCRALLKGLLERDPDKRITFEEFFNNEFLDLEHKPGPDCLNKARELAVQAVQQDSNGNVSEAIKLYSMAVEYFVPALYYEKNSSKKELLQKKVNEYCTRAENLRSMSKNKQTSTHDNGTTDTHFSDLCKNDATLRAVKDSISDAQKQKSFNTPKALEIYQNAIEKLILKMNEENDSYKKKIFASEIKSYLDEAEKIKTDILIARASTSSTNHDIAMENSLKCSLQ